jgi:hypothetical protein
MRIRRLVLAVAAAVGLGLAVVLVVLLVAVGREYGWVAEDGWRSSSIYLLVLPVLVAVWLLRRARRR